MKLKSLYPLLIIVSCFTGCDSGKMQLDATLAENAKLKEKVASLESKIQALEQTDQSFLSRGVDAFNNGNAENILEKENADYTVAKGFFSDLIQKFPTSSLRQQAQGYIAKCDKEINANQEEIKIDEAISNHDFSQAKALIAKMKKDGDLSQESVTALIGKIEKEKNRPLVFDNYAAFQKAAATGMVAGKSYAVYAQLYKSGDQLCEPDDCNIDSWVIIEGNFPPGSKEASGFYDMRGKPGCFTVALTYSGKLEISDFHAGKCE